MERRSPGLLCEITGETRTSIRINKPRPVVECSVTTFRLGWAGKLSVRLPDYIEVGIRVKRLTVATSLLNVDDVTLRLRIDNFANNETRNIYLQSGGVVHIAGMEHAARFKYSVYSVFTPVLWFKSKVGQ